MSAARILAPAYLAGRCANGWARDAGPSIHAVEADPAEAAKGGYLSGSRALCGATMGRRSAGWFMAPAGAIYTCARCAKKAAAHAAV